ncbi:hypothetical protein [Armatimonas sp.]|uniref:hypothetical protein n=1 Tax=Armatimonas sp. TaxID=1872638 RepID=UPI0037502D83
MGQVEVADTNLFARLTGRGTQFLVYQMRYQAAQPTAMILPLPVALPAREDSIRWMNLKNYPEFFTHLAAKFPERQPISLGCSAAETAAAVKSALPVHAVGDFVTSFVPTLADFDRLDPRFTLPKSVWAQFPQCHDYGFAVIQLAKLGGTPHPIAFEFPTRWSDKLFYPTIHIHDGVAHREEHFHHAIYSQGMGAHGGRSEGRTSEGVQLERTQGIVLDEPLWRIQMLGTYENKDVILERKSDLAAILLGVGGAALIAAGAAGIKKARGHAVQ